jgi:hypothetical protein
MRHAKTYGVLLMALLTTGLIACVNPVGPIITPGEEESESDQGSEEESFSVLIPASPVLPS